ncbi:MAG: RidA family protein [Candidatus Dormibacteria bacterium]
MSAEERLRDLGLELPAPQAFGLYLPALRQGQQVWTSGAVPVRDGEPIHRGRVGDEVSLEQAQECARLCVVNALAAIRGVTGDLDQVERVIRLCGFVRSAPGFAQQPQVMNAASQLLIDIFGEAGRGVRSAVGTSELPLGVPVELELLVELSGA